jgi:hypothetical protein
VIKGEFLFSIPSAKELTLSALRTGCNVVVRAGDHALTPKKAFGAAALGERRGQTGSSLTIKISEALAGPDST